VRIDEELGSIVRIREGGSQGAAQGEPCQHDQDAEADHAPCIAARQALEQARGQSPHTGKAGQGDEEGDPGLLRRDGSAGRRAVREHPGQQVEERGPRKKQPAPAPLPDRAPIRPQQATHGPAGQKMERRRQVHVQPWHLLARPAVDGKGHDHPVDQEGHKGHWRRRRTARSLRHSIGFPPAQIPDHPAGADQDGQVLVQGHDKDIVVPRLVAPRLAVLGQPVPQLPDCAGGKALDRVREHGSEQWQEDGPEDAGAHTPQPSVPEETERDADGDQCDLDDGLPGQPRLVVDWIPAQYGDRERRGERQDQRHDHRHQIKGGQDHHLPPRQRPIAEPVDAPIQEQEGTKDKDSDETGFLGRQAQRKRRCQEVQILRAALGEIVQDGIGHDHVEEDGHVIVADEPRAEHQHRRNGHEGDRRQGAFGSQPAPEQERRQRDQDAHQRGQQPRRRVRVAKQCEHQRRQVIEQRPVVYRVVLVSLPGIQLPGLPGVDALVVAVASRAEVVEPRDGQEQHQPDERQVPACEPHTAQQRPVQPPCSGLVLRPRSGRAVPLRVSGRGTDWSSHVVRAIAHCAPSAMRTHSTSVSVSSSPTGWRYSSQRSRSCQGRPDVAQSHVSRSRKVCPT